MAKKVRLDVTYGADTVCVLRHGGRSAVITFPENGSDEVDVAVHEGIPPGMAAEDDE